MFSVKFLILPDSYLDSTPLVLHDSESLSNNITFQYHHVLSVYKSHPPRTYTHILLVSFSSWRVPSWLTGSGCSQRFQYHNILLTSLTSILLIYVSVDDYSKNRARGPSRHGQDSSYPWCFYVYKPCCYVSQSHQWSSRGPVAAPQSADFQVPGVGPPLSALCVNMLWWKVLAHAAGVRRIIR